MQLADLRHNPALPAAHWPLFDIYPQLAALLQPLALCNLPSPVEALPVLGAQAWVKRDDAIHPRYGGNKMRKLEFVASELLRKGIRHVYSQGGTICTPAVSRKMMQDAASVIEKNTRQNSIRVPEPILLSDWFAPGYGCSNPPTEAAIRRGKTAGLTLDPTYSGKAFGDFLKRLHSHDDPLMYWATLNSQPADPPN